MSCSIVLPNLINFFNNDNKEIYEETQKQTELGNTNNSNNNINQESVKILNSILESKYTLNPKLKIQETLHQYRINAIIPTIFDKENINVNIKNNRLIISALKEITPTQFEKYQKTIDISNKNLDYTSIKAQFKKENNNTLLITILKQSIEGDIKIQIE